MPNRLAAETSLYLRQHANNPVDWFPWGPEALGQAAAADRPIFLSVGYSACHWCHVMEHECFEKPAIAGLMNEHFVNVKVDREERPDLDQIYMTAHHALNRGEGGGWPLSVFLTPAGRPFYAGTYFPPDDRYAPQRPSFPKLLTAIANAWATNRDHLEGVGKSVADFLADMGESEPGSPGVPSADVFPAALKGLKRSYDSVHGGFGHAPKFPHAVDLRLLLRIGERTGSNEALPMVRHTLEKMARGGMYDQVGGGFHRYSVDARWLVPHFEKMLYDNALLPPAYADAFLVTGDPFYRHVACETLDYVLRELGTPEGAFFSTQDADSEGEEGKFYVWTLGELEDAVGTGLADLAARTYGVTPDGNFEGHSILCRARSDEQDAALLGMSVDDFRTKLSEVKCKLYGRRSTRVWPGRDEKILTAWNGLAINALAHAGMAFDLERYTIAAARAAEFVLAHLRGPDGRLFRTRGVGTPAKLAGYLDDYAYLADGLVTLYEATFEARWLTAATELTEAMLAHFADPAGGFYYTADDHETLIARTKDLHDNATPAGNAVAATVLARLVALTGRDDFRSVLMKTLTAGRTLMAESPMAAAQLLIALDVDLGPTDEVAVIAPAGHPDLPRVLATIRGRYRPNQVVAFHDPAGGDRPACALAADKPAMNGDVTVYVCRDFACQAPLVGAAAIEAAFGRG